ncbi:hypothetical protein EZV62_021363 [Acer yangbiense]|uniref:F-box domain-containing protein n=1 Tax=Acer yangbiense TaxID=1000413 RepID=A0A5C7H5C5_9ROSI|nr:hypothetical protein EZV62_021363 [Acer yangbiense]
MGMASIPDSLIFEFLIRVPVKSLSRFKCVNKFWRSLISNPDFMYTQLQTTKSTLINHHDDSSNCLIISYLLHDHDHNLTTVHFYTIKDHHDHPSAFLEFSAQVTYDSYHFLPPCNGLLCFYSARAGIYVCNPSIGYIVRIPDSIASGFRLLSCGFGFDQHTRSYKIIRILEKVAADHDDGLRIEVLTMGVNSRMKMIYGGFRFPNRQPPVYANGFFYWINNNSSGFFIQSFDIGSERFGIIQVPENVSGKDWRLFSLEELGGDQLCLVDLDFEMEGKKRMDLWMFKGVSWVQETILHPSEPLDATRPVAFHSGEILLHGFIRGLDPCLNWYHLQTRRFRGAYNYTGQILSPYFHVRPYVHSLVSLQL